MCSFCGIENCLIRWVFYMVYVCIYGINILISISCVVLRVKKKENEF